MSERPVLEIRLEQTCGACPEQYDAFVGTQKVGYLRLRHGHFTVECPHSGGDLVYEAEPDGDGCFTVEEQDGYLDAARRVIRSWLSAESHPNPEDPMDFDAFRARIKQRLESLKARFGDDHPDVQALEADVKEAEAAAGQRQDAPSPQAP